MEITDVETMTECKRLTDAIILGLIIIVRLNALSLAKEVVESMSFRKHLSAQQCFCNDIMIALSSLSIHASYALGPLDFSPRT